MAVLTNKPVRISRLILEGLGLAKYFRCIYGGNSFERKKPDPFGMLTLLRELDAEPREAMMVGDSGVDIQTARNSATWACGVSYGFAATEFAQYPPDAIIDSLTDLPALLGSQHDVRQEMKCSLKWQRTRDLAIFRLEVLYHSHVSRNPSSNPTVGLYPSIFRAAEMSACECKMSPERGGSYFAGAFFPQIFSSRASVLI